jgi:hypothetical protein
MDGLFHRDIGFPIDARLPVPGLRLRYTAHAMTRSVEEGVPADALPGELPGRFDVIELSIEGGDLRRWLVRFPCLQVDGWDWVLAVTPAGVVVTVWLNHEDDYHRNLDTSKYLAPRLHLPEAED